jgi:hypothetical protein
VEIIVVAVAVEEIVEAEAEVVAEVEEEGIFIWGPTIQINGGPYQPKIKNE